MHRYIVNRVGGWHVIRRRIGVFFKVVGIHRLASQGLRRLHRRRRRFALGGCRHWLGLHRKRGYRVVQNLQFLGNVHSPTWGELGWRHRRRRRFHLYRGCRAGRSDRGQKACGRHTGRGSWREGACVDRWRCGDVHLHLSHRLGSRTASTSSDARCSRRGVDPCFRIIPLHR